METNGAFGELQSLFDRDHTEGEEGKFGKTSNDFTQNLNAKSDPQTDELIMAGEMGVTYSDGHGTMSDGDATIVDTDTEMD